MTYTGHLDHMTHRSGSNETRVHMDPSAETDSLLGLIGPGSKWTQDI